MAHNIDRTKGQAFYSLKEKAWHGLGTVVQEAKTSEEVIKLAKLDYNVSKAKVFASYIPDGYKLDGKLPNGKYTLYDKYNVLHTIPKKGEVVPNAYVTYREDTYDLLMSSKVVTDRYTIVQNIDAFKWLDGLMDSSNITIETAGALGRGERMFISAKLPGSYRIHGDNSEIDKYLLFTNTHDGSGRLQVLITPVRVVCNNTLNIAIRGSNNKYQITHTKTAHKKLDFALEMLNIYNIYEKHHIEVLNSMAKDLLPDVSVRKIIHNLILSPSELQLVNNNNNSTRGIEEISTRKINKISALTHSIYNGIGQDSIEHSKYWMLNGISNYYQNKKSYDNKEDMLDTISEGEATKVMNQFMELVN